MSHDHRTHTGLLEMINNPPILHDDPGYAFYVNMVKRRDGTVVNDLSKTDGIIYHTPEEAQAAIDKDPETSNSRRVVEMVAKLTTLED